MSTVETIPMKIGAAIPSLQKTSEISKMIKAIESAGVFTIERKDGSIKVYHTESKREVLKALQKGPNGPWITRIDKKLFE